MQNKIKFLDLKKEYKFIKKEINLVIRKVLESSQFVGGREVRNFEKKFAKFCKVKYAISVNSGTDALFLALKAIGIQKNDEVITTPFSFIATAEVVANIGARPVFVDIDTDSFNIDVSKIKKAISSKTKAIIPVHLFGQMAEMSEIIKIAQKYKIFVIEDACQAIGAEYKKKKAGSIGDFGCFSFFPSKNLGAYGDGGMVVTNNKKLAEKIVLLKNHGSSEKDKYRNLILGTNSRLDTLQAAILNVKLRYLKNWQEIRQEIAQYYTQNLKNVGDIVIPKILSERVHIFNQYTIKTKKRDELKEYLKKHHIETMIYYPIPLHLQPCFKYLGYKKGDYPEAEKASEEVLSLPIHPYLSKKEQFFIVQKIKSFYRL